ncbi:glycosyltransferase family A protein [Cellulophaga sp. BC115SP]|uniref:glycosyltransferase family 2 protein n=1 Tax=Cellulophaga sp. BC115SP TaxID=2683263 RepID=UPI001411B8BA|nr:glycosyltransferase family A protein [Cellulophaga sp. BC115SP]NBB31614.1 glycosyltransferase [Cellulophaga sp. BC115SP]
MISIVIPLYNKAHTVQRTIMSIISQDYKDFEVIIVDDGSTDNGIDIIKSLISDNRFKIIQQENQGVSVARNRGVKESSYNYIAFLDADDEWKPQFLTAIINAITKFPEASMWGTSSIHKDLESNLEKDDTVERYREKVTEVNYWENPHTMSHTSATVVSKKKIFLVDSNGDIFPPGMACCEDWACFNRLAMIDKVVYIGLPLSVRNVNVKGQITGMDMAHRKALKRHVVNYYNLVDSFSQGKTWIHHDYQIFKKYDFRQRILSYLNVNDFDSIDYFLQNLSKDYLNDIPMFEKYLYPLSYFSYLSKIYIYLSKIFWRFKGYPRVGETK